MKFRYVMILFVVVLAFSFATVHAAGIADASYQALRDYAYGLLSEADLDEGEFTKLVVDQGYKYRFVDWLGDAYYSLFFNNPKGSEVLYNDFVMALAVGYERMGKPDNLKKPLTRIIDRRIRMWHGTKNSNHYVREYASLASLANLLGDERFDKLQEKVRQSVNVLYLADGYAYEGPEYGLYSMSILSGYVYFTDDEKVKQKIISNINWLASISSVDRYRPPFDEVNDYWQSNFTFNNIPVGNTYNKQEIIWRYDNGSTVWLRHRSRNKEWQGLHRNYSNGDVLLKVSDAWWLVSPGYQGWEKKQARPEQHNIAMSKWSYIWRSMWRVFGGEATLLYHDETNINKAVIQLDGEILRTVESDSGSLVVTDSAKRNFKQFWQINGDLVGKRQDGDIISLQWQQGDKILNQTLSGVYKISIKPDVHTGEDKTDLIKHNRLMVEGREVVVRFVW